MVSSTMPKAQDLDCGGWRSALVEVLAMLTWSARGLIVLIST